MRQSEILSLSEHAGRLLAWLDAVHPVPRFESIFVLDTTEPSVEYLPGSGGGWRAPASAVRTIAEFSLDPQSRNPIWQAPLKISEP